MLYIGNLLSEFIDSSLVNLNAETPESEREKLIEWIEGTSKNAIFAHCRFRIGLTIC